MYNKKLIVLIMVLMMVPMLACVESGSSKPSGPTQAQYFEAQRNLSVAQQTSADLVDTVQDLTGTAQELSQVVDMQNDTIDELVLENRELYHRINEMALLEPVMDAVGFQLVENGMVVRSAREMLEFKVYQPFYTNVFIVGIVAIVAAWKLFGIVFEKLEVADKITTWAYRVKARNRRIKTIVEDEFD